MTKTIKRCWKFWDEFWFSKVDLYNLALFRIVYAGTLFLLYFSRQKDVSLFYTESGLLPRHLALDILSPAFRPHFLLSFWSDTWAASIHGLFVFSLLMICLGLFSRFFAGIAWVLHLGFLFRNYGVAFGVDQITAIWLFYLMFTNSDAEISLKAYFFKERRFRSSDLLTSVFYRMLQLQLCIIYFYSGVEKLKGQTWWDGTALWSVFANPQMVIADLTWTKHFPFLILTISFGTILFELYFPVLVWVKKMRPYFLAAGICFHAGIGFLLALWGFALVMISPYALFLPQSFIKQKIEKLNRRRNQISPSML